MSSANLLFKSTTFPHYSVYLDVPATKLGRIENPYYIIRAREDTRFF